MNIWLDEENVIAEETLRQLDAAAQAWLRAALVELDLSARAYDRVLKVARTIADLAGAEAVDEEHVFEASQYRALDRSYWT